MERGVLDKLIEEFERARTGWLKKDDNGKKATYIYKITTERSVSIVFLKGQNVWKIDNL